MPRKTRFDTPQLGLDVMAAPERFVPRCACGAFAHFGWREPGLSNLRMPISQWFCGPCHRAAWLATSTAPVDSTAVQSEAAAGESPGKGEPDSRTGAVPMWDAAQGSQFVTGSESVEGSAGPCEALSDPDDDTL